MPETTSDLVIILITCISVVEDRNGFILHHHVYNSKTIAFLRRDNHETTYFANYVSTDNTIFVAQVVKTILESKLATLHPGFQGIIFMEKMSVRANSKQRSLLSISG